MSYSPFKGFDPGPIAVSLSELSLRLHRAAGLDRLPAALRAGAVEPIRSCAQAPAALNDAVGQLLDRQSLDGAFGLWRVGDGEADPWLGAYATDFLIEAQGAPARRCRRAPSTRR